jgi:hypothetical protein
MPNKLLEIFVKKITRGKATLVATADLPEFELPIKILPPQTKKNAKLNLEFSETEQNEDQTARKMLEEIIN